VDLGHKSKVTREAIDLNEPLLETVLQHLGSRVGVELVYFHLDALYKLMKVPVDSFMAGLIIDFFSWVLGDPQTCESIIMGNNMPPKIS
jgi:hypothetical protein